MSIRAFYGELVQYLCEARKKEDEQLFPRGKLDKEVWKERVEQIKAESCWLSQVDKDVLDTEDDNLEDYWSYTGEPGTPKG